MFAFWINHFLAVAVFAGDSYRQVAKGIRLMKIESGKDKMLTLVGKGVSPGLAKGRAFVYIDVLQ